VRQKAKVFTPGRSQAVRLPAAFCFDTKEVFIERNPRTGDVILSRKPANWSEVFDALDRACAPEDFLADRDRSLPQKRETVRFVCSTRTTQLHDLQKNGTRIQNSVLLFRLLDSIV